jgi:hypothetical protein
MDESLSIKSQYATQYEVFLQVVVMHNYYDNGRCKDLVIEPTIETKSKLRGYNILYKPQRDGFMLALNRLKDYTLPNFLRAETFDFGFKINNPQFLRFTDLPYESGQFHVFENLDAVDGRMHSEQYVGQSTCQSTDNEGIAGIIRIHHLPEKPLFFNSSDDAQNKSKLHFIHFNNRKVRVKYLCYGNSNLTNNSQFIFVENVQDNIRKDIFTSPIKIKMKSGDDGLEFFSKDEIDLKEKFPDYWQLKRGKSAGFPFEYKKVLPLPKPEGVVGSENGFVCELIVKL